MQLTIYESIYSEKPNYLYIVQRLHEQGGMWLDFADGEKLLSIYLNSKWKHL